MLLIILYTVHPDALPDYEGVDTSNPNAVVMADAADSFTYDTLNQAFRILISLKEDGTLISLGQG
jgi:phospholysine phosphohistidine inorganic pyrophosphate phosphatase